jgi:hypothetical protein
VIRASDAEAAAHAQRLEDIAAEGDGCLWRAEGAQEG